MHGVAGRWRFAGVAVLAVLLVTTISLVSNSGARAGAPAAPPPNFKVAFIGDLGIGANAEAVLQLILDEGADMVLHQGDLGYGNETDPQTAIDWDAMVTGVLGADFPYFASIGNHDLGNWSTYQQLLLDRLALVSGASCTGNYGVAAACTYQGLFFILSGIGTDPLGPDNAAHLSYIASELAADDSLWRICSWHKIQTAMQVGLKPNEVGWGAYENCRQEGAIIATGHEHSYSRTRTLGNMSTQAGSPLWPDGNTLHVGGGETFAFVSGLAGKSIRNQDRCLPATPPYGCNGEWAAIYTSNQGANYGALFIEFHVDGDPRKASGYFKDIDDNIIDSFTVYADAPSKLPDPGDTDGDGCSDQRENTTDETIGGRRDFENPWDFYDTNGDGIIDLSNDIFFVIQHYAPTGTEPEYDVAFDRGPSTGPNAWNMTAPDGVIDLTNDILGVIVQYLHDCS
ncbi:MAG: metallophosphoesterase [Chloroflexi bacterium]|nr:metallophosphoesterase [Chloroflexota bacterium]